MRRAGNEAASSGTLPICYRLLQNLITPVHDPGGDLIPLCTGKKAAAAAAAAAYDDNIDTAVALGWAYVERLCFQVFSEELSTAPAAAKSALQQLATLYGLTRLERGLAFFLASGALRQQQAAAVRAAVNSLCRRLMADGGRTIWKLCDGFGIPDELLFAPIAFDWTVIGSGDREL